VLPVAAQVAAMADLVASHVVSTPIASAQTPVGAPAIGKTV
jgi:hypothetical protein